MSRPRRLAEHLTVEQLEARYKACQCRIERTRWQAIWLLAKGWTTIPILEATGLGLTAFQAALRRYNADGPAGLRDRRHDNHGQAPLLTDALAAELRAALAGPAPDGGLWNGRKVADWMAAKSGRKVAVRQGQRALHQLGYSTRRPRRRHTLADPQAQEDFKKGASPGP
jgi:transposase